MNNISHFLFTSSLLVFLTLFIPIFLIAQPIMKNSTITSPSLSSVKMPFIAIEEYDLPNGLHVVLHQNNNLPIITTNLTYHVGSKNEDPTRTGFAHFFEHLMFEGTENIKRGQIDKLVSSSGGNFNAGTSFDYTNYYFVMPSNQLDMALWIESERMRASKINHEGVETQRQVVKEERRSRYDNQPYGDLFENLASLLFKNTPYEWTPIGSFQYIDQATIEEFQAFYKKYYIPNNATLVAAGDFQITQVKSLIEKYFSPIPKGKDIAQPKISFDLNVAGETKSVEDKKTPLPLSVSAWRIPSQTHFDSYPLDLLVSILSSGQSSRLYKKLVAQKQIAVNVDAWNIQTEAIGGFGVIIVGHPHMSIQELDSAVQKEIEDVVANGITSDEFEKAMQQKTTAFSTTFKSLNSRASTLGYNHTFFKNANRINTEFEEYKKVTIEDIQRVAKMYLQREKKFLLHYPVPKIN